jgi:ribosomal subunit interface protein
VRRIVEGKLARIERMLNNSAVSAQVVLSKEKTGSRADVTLHARGEKFLHGAGRGENLGAAMAAAVEKLANQAQTLKGKWQERKRRGGAKAAPAPSPAEAVAVDEAPPTKRARVRMPRILQASRQTIRTMSVGDAADLIDGGDGAVIFRDAETSRIAVLYRAAGGDLTLIETEA